MGQEALCDVVFNGQKGQAKALLESDAVILRGAVRAQIPLKMLLHVAAHEGQLTLRWQDTPSGQSTDSPRIQEVSITLGAQAEKWLSRIRNPKSRLDKLGVKTGMRVGLLGTDEPLFQSLDISPNAFAQELAARAPALHPVAAGAELELLFYYAPHRSALLALPALKRSLRMEGGIWVLSPKKNPDITELDVMSLAKEAGLVDVKVVGFSDRLTAAKLVIPRSQRT